MYPIWLDMIEGYHEDSCQAIFISTSVGFAQILEQFMWGVGYGSK
jgi:hypothetical protein